MHQPHEAQGETGFSSTPAAAVMDTRGRTLVKAPNPEHNSTTWRTALRRHAGTGTTDDWPSKSKTTGLTADTRTSSRQKVEPCGMEPLTQSFAACRSTDWQRWHNPTPWRSPHTKFTTALTLCPTCTSFQSVSPTMATVENYPQDPSRNSSTKLEGVLSQSSEKY